MINTVLSLLVTGKYRFEPNPEPRHSRHGGRFASWANVEAAKSRFANMCRTACRSGASLAVSFADRVLSFQKAGQVYVSQTLSIQYHRPLCFQPCIVILPVPYMNGARSTSLVMRSGTLEWQVKHLVQRLEDLLVPRTMGDTQEHCSWQPNWSRLLQSPGLFEILSEYKKHSFGCKLCLNKDVRGVNMYIWMIRDIRKDNQIWDWRRTEELKKIWSQLRDNR